MIEISEQLERFLSEFDISIDKINETIINPTNIKLIDAIYSINLKKFTNSNERRNNLIIIIENIDDKKILCFATWIPEKMVSNNIDLINSLELFSNEFGFLISCNDNKGYFLKNIVFTNLTQLINPNTFISIHHLPPIISFRCLLFSETKYNQFHSLIRITFVFEINRNKLLSWVHSPETITLSVKTNFEKFFKEIVDGLHPNGKTGIEYTKQILEGKIISQDNTMSEIDVPKVYKNVLTHLAKTMNELKEDEKILFKYKNPINYGCIFCGSNNLSDEHIFPKWLRPFINDNSFTTKIILPGDTLNLKATSNNKKEKIHGFTDKSVCTDCNNTWMSTLEIQTKEILIKDNKLIDKIPANLNEKDSNILSKWLILKSLLLLEKNYDLHVIPYTVLYDLKNDVISENFIVETCDSNTNIFNFKMSLGPTNNEVVKEGKLDRKMTQNLAKNLFYCCLQIGRLMFRISYLKNQLPITRATALIKTQVLFPYNYRIYHFQFYYDINKLIFIKKYHSNFMVFTDFGMIIYS